MGSIKQKNRLFGRFFHLFLAVPTGKEPVKRTYLPTDFELILYLFRNFSCKDLLIFRADTETVKQFLGDFVKVETNVDFCSLVSPRELLYFSNIGRMKEVVSTMVL